MANNIQPIVMPKLGLSMTEGMVAKWRVTTGARVAPGDVLADIETSKLTTELETPGAGVIRGELVAPQVELSVGALLCVLADEAATDRQIEEFIAGFVPAESDGMEAADTDPEADHSADVTAPQATTEAAQGATDTSSSTGSTIPDSLQGGADDAQTPATHLARKLAKRLGLNLNKVAGSGRRSRVSKQDIERAVVAAGGRLPAAGDHIASASPAVKPGDPQVRTTPSARRLATAAGLDLAQITPTGTRGRVTKIDVENAIAARSPALAEQTPGELSAEDYEAAFDELPLTPMRRAIARRLLESKQTAPHFRLVVEVNIDPLLTLRSDLNRDETHGKISINDLLVKAVAATLARTPAVNIQFDGKVIRRFHDAHVAVAVALDEGLLTPIVRAANKKSVMEISRTITALSERARARSLTREEFEGGTFTVSNLGMFGIKSFDAIINPPQAAILAVGAAQPRRIPSADGDITATMLTATLSCDHRVIDGATGARFLQSFKELMEHPYQLLV